MLKYWFLAPFPRDLDSEDMRRSLKFALLTSLQEMPLMQVQGPPFEKYCSTSVLLKLSYGNATERAVKGELDPWEKWGMG